MTVSAFKRLWPAMVTPRLRSWVVDRIIGGMVERVVIAANAPLSTLRPQFVVNGKFKKFGNIEDAQAKTPNGIENPAYVDTWSLGPLAPGESKRFRWDVTAVKAGPYQLRYTVAAGLDGKARAVDADGEAPQGIFSGTVSDKAPQTKIAADGKTIIPARD